MAARRAELSEEYLSQVAHEFRGSLNAILGWAEFLRRGPCDDVARVRAAETIIRHARQQVWMVSDLIDMWRLTSGTLKFSIATFDVAKVVQDAVDAVQPLAQARSVPIDLRIDMRRDQKARGDAKRLTQSIAALLLNAVHFAPENTPVTVRLEDGHGAGQLTVHDEGPPVPPGALPYLFERDAPPGGTRSSPRASFRLGLSLVRDVITRHGGSIEAESAGDDDGMTFRLTIPTDARAESTASMADLAEEIRDQFAPGQLDGLRVLLVDDEPDAREALTGILGCYGAVVSTAGSAAEAITALQNGQFDVLLADIGMPGADGYDLIRYVRSLETDTASHLPAVAVTAFTSESDRRRALDAGFQVHLSKPVDPAALVAAVAVIGRPTTSVR